MLNSSRSGDNKTPFSVHFSNLEDPRGTTRGNFHHLLSDILLLTVSAMLCGVNDWPSVITFGESQMDWLKKHGTFASGIPSQDTLERVFAAVNPTSFNKCLAAWMESLRETIPGEVIAIDGKTTRGAKNSKTGKGMPHIVSAWATANGLCLGQVKVPGKSNEITAIPELVKAIVARGCTITIDAMGCQKDIAREIIDGKADYILAVKGNQGNLQQAVEDTVLLEKPVSTSTEEGFGHGRIEERKCMAYNNLCHVGKADEWAGLKTLFVIESKVIEKSTGKETTERRFYISSLPADAGALNAKTRSHWAIENNLHWSLDVTFGEDGSRKRKSNEAENFNIVLKMVMTLLLEDESSISKKRKRLKAALDYMYREKLLGF